jgi:hypothetical protein
MNSISKYFTVCVNECVNEIACELDDEGKKLYFFCFKIYLID